MGQNVLQLNQQAGSANLTSVIYAAINGNADTGLPLSVFVNNLGLTGIPTVPTASPGTGTTQIASTAFVQAAVSGGTYAGSFTNLTATGTVSGAGFNNFAVKSGNLSQFAATTSAQLAGVISDETGSGALVFATSPSLVTPSFASIVNTGTLTLPTSTDTLVGRATTDTLTNKTLTTPTINGAATSGTWSGTPTFSGNVTFTSTITPSQTAGIVGTTTNNSANAGSVGEVIQSTATAVSVSTGVTTNVTSISLTAGDWDVYGSIGATPAATTVITAFGGAISTTSATFSGNVYDQFLLQHTFTASLNQGQVCPIQRISVASTTTVFLIVNIAFNTSTCTAQGKIWARRAR